MENDWLTQIQNYIRQIKALEAQDRMQAHAHLTECVKVVAMSVAGWSQWLVQPQVMNQFTSQELTAFLTQMKKASLAFLKLDVEATKLLYSRMEAAEPKEKRNMRVV